MAIDTSPFSIIVMLEGTGRTVIATAAARTQIRSIWTVHHSILLAIHLHQLDDMAAQVFGWKWDFVLRHRCAEEHDHGIFGSRCLDFALLTQRAGILTEPGLARKVADKVRYILRRHGT